MRILFITQLFDPENAIKGLSFLREVAARGHQVDVLTTFPSYPGGRLYPGFRMRFLQEERYDGVSVFRLPSYISPSRSIIRRLAGYLSFCICAFLFGLTRSRPDIIYSYYPPVFGGIVAVVLARLKRASAVYDVQDLWPEALASTGVTRSATVLAFVESLLRFVYRRVGGIVVLSDGYAEALAGKGISRDKIFRIYNWCDESRLSMPAERADSPNEEFVIAYAGNIGTAQGLDAVVDAAALVAKRGHSRIRFRFVGDGVEKSALEMKASQYGLSNVDFVGRIAPEVLGDALGEADVLLAHLKADPVFSITVPQKTQAYMAMGKPVLMAAVGESARIISEANAGLVAVPDTPESIASAAIRMSQMARWELLEMGRNGQRFYRLFMSQQNGIEQTLACLSDVLEQSGHA